MHCALSCVGYFPADGFQELNASSGAYVGNQFMKGFFMKYLVGIDVGTSAVKTVLFDEKLNKIRSETVEYPLYQPHNGWAEQNPDDWWSATLRSLEKATESVDRIDGIGLSGQMHGLVMLDRNGDALRPAIIWCDQRTEKECTQITDIVGRDKLIEITANPALTGFTASKIMWVKNNEPEIYEKCRHILLPKDYIRFKLTGVFKSEASDAGGMQLLDIKNRVFSEEILKLLGIERELLPDVCESPDITGYVNIKGKFFGTPVVGGAGDNAAAAVGCGAVREKRAFTTIGTSGVVYAHTDKPVIDTKGRVHTFCCAVPGKWHVMGVTQSAGLSLKWFRENFAPELTYSEMDNMAEKVRIGAEKLLFLPYLMGERTPHLDPNARGTFIGISAIHTKAHFIRAILEGVAFSLRDCLEVLREMDISVADMSMVGGGSSPLWQQIISGTFKIPIKTPFSNEGAALGVAILAAVGIGLYSDVPSACDKIIRNSTPVFPENSAEYDKFYRIYASVYPRLKEICRELALTGK